MVCFRPKSRKSWKGNVPKIGANNSELEKEKQLQIMGPGKIIELEIQQLMKTSIRQQAIQGIFCHPLTWRAVEMWHKQQQQQQQHARHSKCLRPTEIAPQFFLWEKRNCQKKVIFKLALCHSQKGRCTTLGLTWGVTDVRMVNLRNVSLGQNYV